MPFSFYTAFLLLILCILHYGISDMLEALLLSIPASGPPPTSLLSLLTETSGLTTNVSNEIYAPANQQTAGGDGKLYDFAPDPQGRLIKSISANLRYTANLGALTAFFFYWKPGTDWLTRVGLYDDKNAVAGHRVFDDTHSQTVQITASWDGVLKRTFNPPVPQEEIAVRIGGRSGYTYSPAYLKSLVIEYA